MKSDSILDAISCCTRPSVKLHVEQVISFKIDNKIVCHIQKYSRTIYS